MKTKILRTWLIAFASLFIYNASAQQTVNFLVTGVENEELSEVINFTVSDLLSAFNVAAFDGVQPKVEELNITEEAIANIKKLWADCPFTCMDDQIVERAVVQPSKELQIRNIHIVMKPIEGVSKDVSWKKYQEGVITLSPEGKIINFHIALDPQLYISVMGSAKNVDDLERRMLILEYVERFRNAYNLKDLPFLEQIYSDDALIITGKVITPVKSEMDNNNNPKIVYSKQNKQQYLTNLARVFKNNNRINVTFDEISVVRHPAKHDFYGVTLKQGWEADRYSDVGWLFLLWDFTNPDAPQIHVRTWQPTEFNHKPVPVQDEIFTIDDFDI